MLIFLSIYFSISIFLYYCILTSKLIDTNNKKQHYKTIIKCLCWFYTIFILFK